MYFWHSARAVVSSSNSFFIFSWVALSLSVDGGNLLSWLARRIEKAEKTQQSNRCLSATTTAAFQRAKKQAPVVGTQSQGLGQPAQYLLPIPLYQPQPSSTRPVGPCIHCGEVGHLKSNCPISARRILLTVVIE